MSSGNVTRLFAYKSRFLSLLIVYKLLMLAGAIELYERFKFSNLSKSSRARDGITRI
jgi:hypothetical protein